MIGQIGPALTRALCLLAIALTAVAASDAQARNAATPLREQVKKLQRVLRIERGKAARLRLRTAELKRTLSIRTTERDDALRRAASSQAKLDSGPSALNRAVEQVRREVAYSRLVLEQAGAATSRETLIAHAAMTYVVGHVSAPGYGYMNVVLGTRPVATAEGALQAESGICGHAALTFAAIVKRFGLPVRSVQFYYGTGNNHIAAEVFFDGGWHYFDPTYGAYYGEPGQVLSIQQARERPDAEALLRHNSTLLWSSVGLLAGYTDLLDFGSDPATRVEIDQQQFVG